MVKLPTHGTLRCAAEPDIIYIYIAIKSSEPSCRSAAGRGTLAFEVERIIMGGDGTVSPLRIYIYIYIYTYIYTKAPERHPLKTRHVTRRGYEQPLCVCVCL